MSEQPTNSSPLAVRARVPVRDFDVDLEVPAGRTLALIGPNAAGKSTLLQVTAGLLIPDAGRVTLGDRVLTDTEHRTLVPVHRRRIGWLAQSGLLFAHLDVVDNVAFGARSQRVGKQQARAQALEWLERLGVADLADRRPRTLSGGQAQRVALARTLASRPEALLLDEPTSALDVHVAAGLRRLLAETLEGRTTILVSHDLLDIVALADDVAVIESGRIVERGPVGQVLSRPESKFAARLADVNVVRGELGPAGQLTGQGLVVHGVPDDPDASTGRGLATFRAASVTVALTAPQTSARNVWAGEIRTLATVPSGVRLWVGVGDAEVASDVTAASAAELRLAPGGRVWLAVKAQEVAIAALG